MSPILLQEWKQRGESRKVGAHKEGDLVDMIFSAEMTVSLEPKPVAAGSAK
jgi:hypothetical protein